MRFIDTSARNNFTLLRLILATLVVFGHSYSLTTTPEDGEYRLSQYSGFAVQAFFVISGYLITGSWDKTPRLADFYIKRFFRIYPLYIAVIVLQAIAMIALLPPGRFDPGNAARYLVVNAVFLNFLQYDIGGLFDANPVGGINPSLWTLKIEIAFYAILPLLWALHRRFGAGTMVSIFVLSTLYFEAVSLTGHETLAKQLPAQMRYFAVGILLYAWRDRFRISPPVAAATAAILLLVYSMIDQVWLDPVAPLLAGSIVFLTATRLPSVRLKRDISFGVYLFHAPMIQVALLLGLFHYSYATMGLVTLAVYLLAFAAEQFIELPGIALGRRLLTAPPRR